MKYEIIHRVVKNIIENEKVTIHYIKRNEFPKFLAIIHYESKLTFWFKDIDECSREECENVIEETKEFLANSKEAQSLTINYEVNNGNINF